MQPGELARQIQSDAVTRNSGRRRAVMKSFEDVFTGWNRPAGIPDSQHNIRSVPMGTDPDAAAGAIVLSRVLQEILYNQRRVLSFAGYEQANWKFFFDFHIRRIRKRPKIIEPLIDKLTKIYGCRRDLEMPGVHARQKKQIVNYPGQTVGLMEQS